MAQIECPLRIRDRSQERRACCTWDVFLQGFIEAWPKFSSEPPSQKQWLMARKDWQAANTGWEAAHNAMSRAKDAAEPKPEYVWIGGRNYAPAGSPLAIKFGMLPSPPAAQGINPTPWPDAVSDVILDTPEPDKWIDCGEARPLPMFHMHTMLRHTERCVEAAMSSITPGGKVAAQGSKEGGGHE